MSIDTEALRQLKQLRDEVAHLKRREQPIVAHTARSGEIFRRPIQERISDRGSALDLISDRNEREAVRAGTSYTDKTDMFNIMVNSSKPWYVPPGTYIINGDGVTGAGRAAHNVLGTYDNTNIEFDPLARVLVQDGAISRWLIQRNVKNVSIRGGQIIDQKTAKSGNGISFENVSNGYIGHVRIKDFGSYAISVSQDTSAPVLISNTFSFDAATHRIYDLTNAALDEIQVADILITSGSAYNNGYYHIVDTSGDGAWVETIEALINEAAATVVPKIVSSAIAIDATLKLMYSPSAAFFDLDEGNVIRTSGFPDAANNRDWTVVDITTDGMYLSVAEAGMVSYGGGVVVTISIVSTPKLQIIRAAACNEITVEHNYAAGIGTIAYEIFPKKISNGLLVFANIAYNSGYDTPGGTGIKVGTNYTDGIVLSNRVWHCQNGVNIGNWGVAHYAHNIVLNAQKYAYAITASRHPLTADITFEALTMAHNIAAYTQDFSPDVDGEPVISTADFVPANPYSAININGLFAPEGLMDLSSFIVHKWSRGWYISKSRVKIPNLHIRDSVFNDCGSSFVDPLVFTGTVTNGSPTITGLTNTATGVVGTAGWYAESDILGQYIQEDTKVLAVNPTAGVSGELVMTANATGNGMITFYSGCPDDFDDSGNVYINTDLTRNVIDFVQGRRARSWNNVYKGYGAINLRMRGSGSSALGNRIIEPNPLNTATQMPIVFSEDFTGNGTGIYEARDTYVDLGKYQFEGSGRILSLINYNNTAGIRAANNICSNPDVRPLYQTTSLVLPTLLGQAGNNRFWSAATPPASGNQIGDICFNPATTIPRNIAFWTAQSATTWTAHGRGRGTTAQRPTLGTNDAGYVYRDTSLNRTLEWTGTVWEVPTDVRTLYRGVVNRTAANTVVESTLVPATGVGSLAIGATFWNVGTAMRWTAHGIITSTGTPTLRLRLKQQTSVILVDTGVITLPVLAGTQTWRFEALLTCRSTGASGTIEGSIWFTVTDAAGASTVRTFVVAPVLTTLNVAAGGTMSLTAEWGTAAVANSMTTNLILVEEM